MRWTIVFLSLLASCAANSGGAFNNSLSKRTPIAWEESGGGKNETGLQALATNR